MSVRSVLDVGTNSVRLLVAEVSGNKVIPLIRETRVTRLGKGVDALGCLGAQAIKETLNALQELSSLIPSGVSPQILATSAVRDARNRREFSTMVRKRTGWDLQILSGTKEAQLSFQGAVLSLQGFGLAEPISVVDVGGGSTEIYTGLSNGAVLGGGSVQVGAVRMLERFISSHPLLYQEQLQMEEELQNLLLPLVCTNLQYGPQTLVAVGGSATSLAAIMQQLPGFDYEKVTGFSCSRQQLRDIYIQLSQQSLAELRRIPALQVGREDVIVCGASILVKILELMNFTELTVSVGDLLYGWLVLMAT